MRWLIRRVLKKGKGAISYEEDTHFGEVLTIGRAADQAIFLPDLRAALNHARITLLSNGEYKIEPLILAGIRVNGEIVYTPTAGTIDAAHHFFAADCKKCHQTPFRTVRDNACLACHANTAAHADAVKFNMPELGNAECRSCHQDHQGLRGLIRRDQRLCADCHANLKANTKNASSFDDVKDFGKGHPEFKLNLPNWDANGKFAPQRVSYAPN